MKEYKIYRPETQQYIFCASVCSAWRAIAHIESTDFFKKGVLGAVLMGGFADSFFIYPQIFDHSHNQPKKIKKMYLQADRAPNKVSEN